jgi:NADPH:quinone reductase
MLQIRSLVTADAALHLSVEEIEMPEPRSHEVVVRVDASPINPSDLGLLLGSADLDAAVQTGTAQRPVITVPIPPAAFESQRARIGHSLPVGNEGGGVIVAAGDAPEAQALLGTVVGAAGGAMYSQYRAVPVAACIPMHDGTTATEAASCFVNPLTALGMVETMRAEGHTALVHTAAASNLGQMLNRICLADGIALVNIVRRSEQAELLRSQGATHVCVSTSPTFADELTAAITTTGATIAFDATGGGTLAGDILTCMERSLNAGAEFSRYGSSTHKQLYIYGGLDRSPTTLHRAFGMSWGIGGWLLTPFLQKAGPETGARLRRRVADEITTTFASHYTTTITLAEMLQRDVLRQYALMATGQKYLVTPNA